MPIFDMAKYSFVVRTKRYRDIANLSQLPAENDLMSYNNYGYNAVERRRGFSEWGHFDKNFIYDHVWGSTQQSYMGFYKAPL